jgi:hypothetical protein
MEASFVVPGPLDVAGTLSRFHLWGEDPVNRFADGMSRRPSNGMGGGRNTSGARAAGPTHPTPRLDSRGRRAGVVDAAAADVWRTCGLDLEPLSFRDPAMSEPASRRRAREIVAVHHLLAGRRPEAWAAAGGGA